MKEAKMYFVIYFCIIFFISVQALNDSEISRIWEKYQEEYGKNYKSPVELKRRLDIFKENLKKIEEHNLLYEQKKSTHMEGINQFTDWTTEEFKDYVKHGLILGTKIYGKFFEKTENFKAPQSLDWRDQYVVTSVKNQGKCRGSWAFSAVGALEGQIGLQGSLITLSEQNLIDCSATSGCREGSMEMAYDYVQKDGIQSKVVYPNINAEGSCHADPSRRITRISGFVKIPHNDEDALQEAIVKGGPISAAIHITESLQRYKQGILEDHVCKNASINQAVLIVGLGSENQKDYYIVKNSWGKQWGEEGYFKLPRNDNNKCGIASLASYPYL